MTDYNYNDERVKLGGDTSDNHADGSGRALNLAPIEPWPGTDADPNKIRLDKDALDALADKLQGILDRLDSNTLTHLQTKGQSVSYGDPGWVGATHLKETMGEISSLVVEHVGYLKSSLADSIASLRAAAKGYTGAENTNESSAHAQSAAM